MPRKNCPSVQDAITEYMNSRHHLAKSSRENDWAFLSRMARELGPARRMDSIRAVEVEGFFQAVAATLMESSFNKIRARAILFFAFSVRRGWSGDLMADVPRRRVIKKERLRLSAEQLRELPDLCDDPRDAAFVVLAIQTALRASEIVTLKVGDVDLAEGTLKVYRWKTAEHDELPITKSLDRSLRVWLTTYGEKVGGLSPGYHLFPRRSVRHSAQWDFSEIVEVFRHVEYHPDQVISHPQTIIQAALKKLGIDVVRQEGIHTLRRSSARQFFEHLSGEGHDSAMRIVASLLGHSSLSTTESYIGMDRDRSKRDQLLRGHDFLPDLDTVTPLRKSAIS